MKIKIEGLVGSRLEITSGYGKFGKQLQLLVNPANEESDVRLWITPPYKRDLPKGFNAIFTMHEVETLPESKKDWIDNLNQYNLVIVPTNWNKRVFVELGVKVPIEVIPLGIDTQKFHGHRSEAFSFLTMHDNFGRESSRENWYETLESYIKTFKGIKDTVLYIKTWNYKPTALSENTNFICEKNSIKIEDCPRVEIIDKKFTDEELNQLFSHVWIFIKNANREGWSLPLNEALSSGAICFYRDLPVLNWAKHYYGIAFNSAEQLSSSMLYHYNMYLSAKKRREHYDIRNTALHLLKIIQSHYESKQVV